MIKNQNLFYMIIVCLVCFLSGCKESKELNIVVQGDPSFKDKIKIITETLKEDPQTITVSGSQTRYSMKVIKPDPNVDYKIVRITPDPDVDYKIIVIDPELNMEIPDLSRTFGEALRNKLIEKEEESRSREPAP